MCAHTLFILKALSYTHSATCLICYLFRERRMNNRPILGYVPWAYVAHVPVYVDYSEMFGIRHFFLKLAATLNHTPFSFSFPFFVFQIDDTFSKNS